MNEAIQAFPLQWPVGWKRMHPSNRTSARFGKSKWHSSGEGGWRQKEYLSVNDSTLRVIKELACMRIDHKDVVISTNIPLRLDGLPRSGQREPDDPGAAVYWRKGKESRCIAIDRYDRVQDNIAAIAATLDAMRAIERHGGATILDRAFMGFAALPSPESWWQVLGLKGPDANRDEIKAAHRRLISDHHPDTGGDTEKAAKINRARDQGLEAM